MIMKIINLREFYPWYAKDEYVEVSDEVAMELVAENQYQQAYKRKTRYNKVLSLDADDGIEAEATVRDNDSPDAVIEKKERYCLLCGALNSLPENQGRRIESHYLLGMSREEIASMEGVSESAVNQSIMRGLRAMKKYFDNQKSGLVKCP